MSPTLMYGDPSYFLKSERSLQKAVIFRTLNYLTQKHETKKKREERPNKQ